MIEAKNVHKRYRSGSAWLDVLKGISLTISAGECVAITGPSGAGKSTLLHVLAGLDVPTSGEVLWEGRSVAQMSDGERAALRNRMIGFVFQFYHLLPELSALENVMLPSLIDGRQPRRELSRRAHGCLEQVGLVQRMAHKPSQLSGGEMQRVAIARALMNRPQVVFCDEPTGNLDSHTGRQVTDLLLALPKRDHVSVVLVTHERELAAQADRHLELHDGQLTKNHTTSV